MTDAIEDAQVQSRPIPCRFYGVQSGTGTGVPLNNLVLACQCHSTSALYTHLYITNTLWSMWLRSLLN